MIEARGVQNGVVCTEVVFKRGLIAVASDFAVGPICVGTDVGIVLRVECLLVSHKPFRVPSREVGHEGVVGWSNWPIRNRWWCANAGDVRAHFVPLSNLDRLQASLL